MKDMKGTVIRKGTYFMYVDTIDIYKSEGTFTEEYECCLFVKGLPVKGNWCGPIYLGSEDMVDVLVIPRRMVVPKLKLDQINMYAGLAGLEVVKDE